MALLIVFLVIYAAAGDVNVTNGFVNLTKPTTDNCNTTILKTTTDPCWDKHGEETTTVSSAISDETSTKEPTCNMTSTLREAHGRVRSVNFPEPYYTNCEWTYIINVGAGYNTNIRLDHLDIDHKAGDRFSIEPECTDTHGHYFNTKSPGNQSGEANYQFVCSVTTIRFTTPSRLNNSHIGFSLVFSRYRRSDADYYIMRVPGWVQMYLQGVSMERFEQKEDYFKLGVKKSTEDYFRKNKFNISRADLENAVLLNSVIACPKLWPQSSKCVQVNFSVVLNHKEVNSDQLHEIKKSVFFHGELDKLGISEYQVPNYVAIMWFWIALLVALLFIFCLIALLLTKTKVIGLYFQRLSETEIKDMTYRDCLNIQEGLATQIFSAENSHKYQFIRDYEKNSRFGSPETKYSSGNNNSIAKNSNSMSVIMEEVDDFDSDNEETATVCEASSFSKANTCYHMYAEPQTINNAQKFEPISIIRL